MKCTGGRESRFLVCLHVVRPSPVISTVIRLNQSLAWKHGGAMQFRPPTPAL
ncbi:hypothetical protein SAMN06265222_1561 [Neorhodopirellula lusitana]|uniref:Uncharacterized protein n=1 Tax=Neorhodopirellula lusitana TaxID=445327 RepID=A0ABY1QXA2_9BACT|nr:hypothetical protein SAMN06265222_1561 [Neorhodopirellula lusitana]